MSANLKHDKILAEGVLLHDTRLWPKGRLSEWRLRHYKIERSGALLLTRGEDNASDVVLTFDVQEQVDLSLLDNIQGNVSSNVKLEYGVELMSPSERRRRLRVRLQSTQELVIFLAGLSLASSVNNILDIACSFGVHKELAEQIISLQQDSVKPPASFTKSRLQKRRSTLQLTPRTSLASTYPFAGPSTSEPSEQPTSVPEPELAYKANSTPQFESGMAQTMNPMFQKASSPRMPVNSLPRQKKPFQPTPIETIAEAADGREEDDQDWSSEEEYELESPREESSVPIIPFSDAVPTNGENCPSEGTDTIHLKGQSDWDSDMIENLSERINGLQDEEDGESKVEAESDDGRGVNVETTAVVAPRRRVSCLKLHHCQFDEDAMVGLSELLNSSSAISVLHLTYSKGNFEATSPLYSVFSGYCNIVEVNLSGNNLGDSGATCVADAMVTNKSIRSLNLSANGIENVGAAMLAAMLLENKTLHFLILADNSVGAYGAQDFADALLNNSTLLLLDVGHQRKRKIGVDGAMHFARALRENTSLRALKLASNKIMFEGCRYLCGALLVNNHLQELDIGGKNLLTVEGGMQIAQALTYNTALNFLTVGEFRICVPLVKGLLGKATSDANGTTGIENKHLSVRQSRTPSLEDRDAYDSEDPTRMFTTADVVVSSKLDIQALRLQPFRRQSSTGDVSDFRLVDLQALDELAAVLGILLRKNRTIEQVKVHGAYIPLQLVNGGDLSIVALDLANIGLKSADVLILGLLVSENRRLRIISLHGNDFANSEGEKMMVNALTKNTGLRIDPVWTADQMFADHYLHLASLSGISASGLSVEPMRSEGLLNRLLFIGAAFLYYFGLVSDIATLSTFALFPDIYSYSWVVFSVIFLFLPSMLTSYATLSALCSLTRTVRFRSAMKKIAQILLQLDFYFQTKKSVNAEMEMVSLLETKFMNGIYRSIPNATLQLYIVFVVATNTGKFPVVVLVSTACGLAAISNVLNVLYDRTDIRNISLAPTASNPHIVVWITKLIYQDKLKELSNYNSVYNVHFSLSLTYHAIALTTRAVCITWLLASVTVNYEWVVFVGIFLTRATIVLLFDKLAWGHSFVHNFITALSLCVTDSAWRKNSEEPWQSRNILLLLAALTTMENLAAIFFSSYNTHSDSKLPATSADTIIAVMMLGNALRLLLMRFWMLPIHYSELYLRSGTDNIDNSSSATKRRARPRKATGDNGMEMRDAATTNHVTANVSNVSSTRSSDEALEGLEAGSRISTGRFSSVNQDELKFLSEPCHWLGVLEKRGGKAARFTNWQLRLLVLSDAGLSYWTVPAAYLASLRQGDDKLKKFLKACVDQGKTLGELRVQGFRKKGLILVETIKDIRQSVSKHYSLTTPVSYFLDVDVEGRTFYFRTKSVFDRNQLRLQLQRSKDRVSQEKTIT